MRGPTCGLPVVLHEALLGKLLFPQVDKRNTRERVQALARTLVNAFVCFCACPYAPQRNEYRLPLCHWAVWRLCADMVRQHTHVQTDKKLY